MTAPTVTKGQWFRLPSAKLVQVCAINGDRHPEVVLRYLDAEGAMAPGEFQLSLQFMLKHTRRVAFGSETT